MVNCCIRREESRTGQLLDSFVSALPEDCEVEELVLMDEQLFPLTGLFFDERQALLETKDFNDPRFLRAHRFADADIIVIAAPFWDLSFPALLKLYIENISVDGITFRAVDNHLEGTCRASDMIFLTTRGGAYAQGSGQEDMEMGSRYLKALSKFFGIARYHLVAADGIDMEGADVDAILYKASEEAAALAEGI
ncbi:MAG: NAD(P)H-dependent oxidoreductase [Lachnospiraceae bacterium]|nr:NAD(P)H-dependent oxidoreductase [Lachnospiraceae bacterium]